MSRLRSGQLSSLRFSALLFSGVFTLSGLSASGESPKKLTLATKPAAPNVSGRALPLVFEENAGQLPAGSAFAGRTQSYSVQILPSELRFGLPGKTAQRTVTLSFTGSQGGKPEGMTDAGFKTNIYIGNDRKNWHAGIRNFDRVALRNLYSGVDAEFYSHGNEIEHDFMLGPNADANQLAMHVAGAKTATLNPAGDLVLTADKGALRLHKPNAYQVLANGKHQAVDAQFELAKTGDSADLHFKLGDYDHTRALVIDPVITYATYVAGDQGSTPTSIATDATGNVYLTGNTTSDVNRFGTSLVSNPNSLDSTRVHAFVAKLDDTESGTKIAWLTYYGSATAAVNAGPSVLDSKVNTIVIGGSTTATDLPGTASGSASFQKTPLASSTGSAAPLTGSATTSFGFVASFAADTGGFAQTAYIAGSTGDTDTFVDVTSVGGLAVDPAQSATGAVTIVGATTSSTLPTMNALTYSGFTDNVIKKGNESKGYIITLDSNLATQSFGTYLAGSTIAPDTFGNAITSLKGVAIDGANIYFAGQTYGNFLQAGKYSDDTVAATTSANGGGSDAIAGQLLTDQQTLAYVYDSTAPADDFANGVSFDLSKNLLVFGSTASNNFFDKLTYSTSQTSTDNGGIIGTILNGIVGVIGQLLGGANPPVYFDKTYPAGVSSMGWAIRINSNGSQVAPGPLNGDLTAYTYIGGTESGKSTSITSAAIGTDLGATPNVNYVFLAGITSAAKAGFAVDSDGNHPAGVTALPTPQDNPSDSTDLLPQRSFLLRMNSTISALNYVTNLGTQAGNPTTASVAVSAPASGLPSAYVAIAERPSAAHGYTTASAVETGPQVTDGSTTSAYIAKVAEANGGSSDAFEAQVPQSDPAASDTYSPAVVGYSASAATNITLTWNIKTKDGKTPTNVVFDLPQSANLSPYDISQFSFTGGTGVCKLGTKVPLVNPNPGITCVIPSVDANTTLTFKLIAKLTSGSAFSVTANLFDDKGDSQARTISVTPVAIPVLTFNATASKTSVRVGANPDDANGQVTYTYTVKNNTGGGNSATNVKLVTGLDTTGGANDPNKFTLSSGTQPAVSLSGGGTCVDPIVAGCTIPDGATLTVSYTGVYLASQYEASTTFPYSIQYPDTPTITYDPPVADSTGTGNHASSLTALEPPVSVTGDASITINSVMFTSTTPYNGGFALGDANPTLVVKISNGGPSKLPTYTTTIDLPVGFRVTGTPTSSGASDTTSCTATLPSKCSVTLKAINGGEQRTITVNGTFKDTGLNDDAVPQPGAYPTTPAAFPVSTPNLSVTVEGSAEGTVNGVHVNKVDPQSSSTFAVSRVNLLAVSSYSVTTPSTLPANTVNAYGTVHTNDSVTYTVSITNNGISATRGLVFDFPVADSSVPVSAVKLVGAPAQTAGPNGNLALTCSFVTPVGNPTPMPYVHCVEADLTNKATVEALPSSNTYVIQYSLGYDQSLIAATMTPPTISIPQTAGNGVTYAFNAPALIQGTAGNTYGGATPTTSTVVAPAITVQRAATLTNHLTYQPLNTNLSATNLFDKTRLNLDEHIAGNAHGVNDTIIVTSSITNAGPDDAAQAKITIPLPPAMLVAVPAGCTLNSTAAPIAGSTLQPTAPNSTMVCQATTFIKATTAGTCPATLAVSDAVQGNAGFVDAPNNTCYQVRFYAKFQDLPNTAATIIGSNPTGNVAGFGDAAIAENDIQLSPKSDTTFSANGGPSVTSVQRVAHVHVVSAAFPATLAAPKYTDGTAVSVDGTVTPNLPLVGQAVNRYNVTTRVASGGKLFDCFRYVVPIVNDGPNYTAATSMQYAFSSGVFVPTGSGGGLGTSRSPVNCSVTNTSAANTTAVVGQLTPGAPGTVFLDGYFDLNSLNGANSNQAMFTTLPFLVADAQDGNSALSANDYKSAQKLTIGNTPFNDANTLGFAVNPVVPAGSTQVNLIFTNVSQAGITNALTANTLPCTTTGSINNCFPAAKSPYPPDNGAVRNMYQPGKTPTYYQVPTTAILPTTAGNTTSVCFTAPNSGAFGDLFVKPERVLLWVMKNAAAGTTYGTFKNGAMNAPMVGDVTSFVTPSGVSAYIQAPPPAQITFPQPPQAQPGMVCGQVNGLTTTSAVDASAAASAETFGLLEPVNFPPYVVADAIANSASGSKGSTSGVLDIYLAINGTTATSGYTRDYNDSDPCYIGPAASNQRLTCDDNPYMATRLYVSGGGSNVQLLTKLQDETSTSVPTGVKAKQIATLYATAGTGLFVAVADQATGADAFNSDIAGTPGYTTNPFAHQGNFLVSAYSAKANPDGTAPIPVCDPGQVTFTGYVLTAKACAGGVAAGTNRVFISGGTRDLAVTPNYSSTVGLNGNYFYLGNVGAQGIIATGGGGSGSGLIPLPFPDSSVLPESSSPLPRNPNDKDGTSALGPAGSPTAAIATVTAGGTAGFVWPWLASRTTALGIANGGAPGDLYDLSCAAYDTATQQQQIAFPQGVSCFISTSTPGTSASPTVYTFGTSSDPTIFVTTSGSLTAKNQADPAWKRGLEGIALAMVLPVFFFRKRLGKSAALALVLLTFAAAPLLSGCGSGGNGGGGNGGGTTNATPAGGYYLRVIAKPQKAGKPNITSAVFQVVVKSAN